MQTIKIRNYTYVYCSSTELKEVLETVDVDSITMLFVIAPLDFDLSDKTDELLDTIKDKITLIRRSFVGEPLAEVKHVAKSMYQNLRSRVNKGIPMMPPVARLIKTFRHTDSLHHDT